MRLRDISEFSAIDAAEMIHALMDADTAQGWGKESLQSFLQQGRAWGFAAFLEDQVQGFILGQSAGDEAEILNMAVEPSLRRQGIGEKLLQEFLRAGKRRGAYSVFLEAASGNHAALALYAKSGFTSAGTRPDYYLRANGRREDALLMRLDLR